MNESRFSTNFIEKRDSFYPQTVAIGQFLLFVYSKQIISIFQNFITMFSGYRYMSSGFSYSLAKFIWRPRGASAGRTPTSPWVFITNLARYAIQGYEVDASDFILKPLEYDRFRVRMDKLTALFAQKQSAYIVLPLAEQKIRVAVEDILYAEVVDHDLQVVTTKQRYLMRCSLQEMERMVEGHGFSRCNRCYLMNLSRVSGVEKDAVRVGKHMLSISRPRKKQFLQDLSDCLGA